MIKGCSRRMIILKDTGSDFFEEAYFVLKSQHNFEKIRTEKDFLAEANRIVQEASSNSGGLSLKTQNRKKHKLYFSIGVLCGMFLSSIFVAVSYLI